MIGSLMYLTASRPDIQFSTCLYARYQANPKESHLMAFKRIFRKSTSGACHGCCAYTMDEKSTHRLMTSYMRRYQFIRDHILKVDIEFHFIPTQYQLVDIFTKPLDEPTFKILIVELVLKDSTKVWFSTPIGGIKGEVGVTSYRNAIGANYLAHLKDYAKPPTIETVMKWFPTIGYGRAIEATRTLKKDDIFSKLKKKNREKVIPYPRFLSLLLEHKMKGYGTNEVNLNPTQIFNVLNWSLKKNQSKGPPFTDHILAICNAAEPVAFIASTSSKLEKKVSQGKQPEATTRRRMKLTYSLTKRNPLSKFEAPKNMPSLNEAVESPTSHSKRKKSGMAKDTNQASLQLPPLWLHKEVYQATSGPTSLGVTGDKGANPQLNSVILASHSKPVYSASIIIHFKSASGHDALVDSTAEADHGKSAPND
ncbi:hypothetical protein Tco_0668445 [Tanacetum coccineum]